MISCSDCVLGSKSIPISRQRYAKYSSIIMRKYNRKFPSNNKNSRQLGQSDYSVMGIPTIRVTISCMTSNRFTMSSSLKKSRIMGRQISEILQSPIFSKTNTTPILFLPSIRSKISPPFPSGMGLAIILLRHEHEPRQPTHSSLSATIPVELEQEMLWGLREVSMIHSIKTS